MADVIATRQIQNKANTYKTKLAEALNIIKKAVENHDDWEVEDSASDDDGLYKLIVKNKSGLLNYDPRLFFWRGDGDDKDDYIRVSPCKNYDSDKEWYEQEGAISKDDAHQNYKVCSRNSWNLPLLSKIIITKSYMCLFSLVISGNYIYSHYSDIEFFIFDAEDKDNSGMYIIKNREDYPTEQWYLYANSIWYGKTTSSLWNKISKLDVDKSNNMYHYPTPFSTLSAVPKTFFINNQDKDDPVLWEYVGKSYDYFTKFYDTDDITGQCGYKTTLRDKNNNRVDYSIIGNGLVVEESKLGYIDISNG